VQAALPRPALSHHTVSQNVHRSVADGPFLLQQWSVPGTDQFTPRLYRNGAQLRRWLFIDSTALDQITDGCCRYAVLASHLRQRLARLVPSQNICDLCIVECTRPSQSAVHENSPSNQPGRDCPRAAHRGARSGHRQTVERGINGGDPRPRGAEAVYAAKVHRAARLTASTARYTDARR
jgi:hypothetical protein